MTTWIVLLRGINVGGKNILPMKQLSATLAEAGYTDVMTYIQSGNVVLQSSKRRNAGSVARHIEQTLFDTCGLRTPTLVLSVKELEDAIRSNPYPTAESDPKSLHLFFLERAPAESGLSAVSRLKSESESFAILGKTLYLHAPDGVGRSRFARGTESALGVAATARNWRTVKKLIELTAAT